MGDFRKNMSCRLISREKILARKYLAKNPYTEIACVAGSFFREPVFSCAHYFQAPSSQANTESISVMACNAGKILHVCMSG